MEIPGNLSYTKDHEWITAQTGTAKVGITAFAVEQLGDIVHIELPEIGQSFANGESFGTVESTKTVSDLNMPLAGKVLEVNSKVLNNPESLQTKAYDDGWLIKVEISPNANVKELLDAAAYGKFIRDQH